MASVIQCLWLGLLQPPKPCPAPGAQWSQRLTTSLPWLCQPPFLTALPGLPGLFWTEATPDLAPLLHGSLTLAAFRLSDLPM
jgi:hypothetical protein